MDRLAVMETYLRVVETRSFSAAARRLNVGQPAVSKSVAQLEKRLGVRLLVRSTRCLKPTEAGQDFYERARRIVDEAEQAHLAARGAGVGLAGRLRVSAAVTLSRLHIVPRLQCFLQAHPNLSVDLLLNDRQIDLIGEGVDVALRTGVLRDFGADRAPARHLSSPGPGTPAYFERAGTPSRPADLLRHAAVVYTEQREGAGGECWSFRKDGAETSIMLSGRLRVGAAEGVRAAVIAGLGFAIASEWMFAPEIARGTVRPVLCDWALPMLDLWAVFPTGRLASAKARAFAAFVEAELRRPHSAAE